MNRTFIGTQMHSAERGGDARSRAMCGVGLFLLSLNAWAAPGPDLIDMTNIAMGTCTSIFNTGGPTTTFAAKPGVAVPVDSIELINPPSGTVYWLLETQAGCSVVNSKEVECAGIHVIAPGDNSAPVASSLTASVSGTATTGSGRFNVRLSDPATGNECTVPYEMRATLSGGGWGDPHINTVDGVSYDFQSAGEFTLLRNDFVEVQVRQSPVASTAPLPPDAYTGLSSCVSLYSAVAVRIGKHRVTYQPKLKGGIADPSDPQLRVDGQLVTLGDQGLDLEAEDMRTNALGGFIDLTRSGRIQRPFGATGIEVLVADGSRVVVTAHYWSSMQLWYFNVNVYDTVATAGIMGKLASGSWLPALRDGSSIGAKPASLHDRYLALYGKFEDSWRVGKQSLFDYEPGTSTATFTDVNWPAENPKSCGVPGQTSPKPATQATAERACSGIADETLHKNCVADVMVTGNPQFAEGYAIIQKLGTRDQSPRK